MQQQTTREISDQMSRLVEFGDDPVIKFAGTLHMVDPQRLVARVAGHWRDFSFVCITDLIVDPNMATNAVFETRYRRRSQAG